MVDTSLGQTDYIGYLLQHLSATLAKQSDQMLMERLGIGFSQFKIMRIVQSYPTVTQRDIAERLGQTEASISRQVKLLQERGLLAVTISPENRREHHSSLTPKGTRIIEEVFKTLHETYAPMFDSLGDKRQKQLLETLGLMHEHLCVEGKIGACHKMYKQKEK